MTGMFSRFLNKSALFSVYRRCLSQAITRPEIHPNDEVYKLSTLFVPGGHGANMYQIVKPVIDIDYITCNLGNLKLSCDHRGINLDLNYLLKVAKEWLCLRDDYLSSVEQDQKYLSELNRLNSVYRKDEFESIDRKRKELVDIIIAKKKKLHEAEDVVMPLFQKIPHVLHTNTPLQFNVIDVCREPQTLDIEAKSHVEIANFRSELTFLNNSPITYFTTGKLSQLDLSLQMYFMDKLNNLGFFPMSCVDFCKSFIIEAIGYDPYSNLDTISVKGKGSHEVGQRLHLVGGASFETFCAYFTNMNVNRSTLPASYFSIGRRYNAANQNSNSLDLFSTVQSMNVHSIILSESSSFDAFDILLNAIINCYSELDIPFRMVNVAAKNLTIAESHRKQLELWSPALKDYLPVAYVSQHDDFVSKRLNITYGFQYEKEGYCHVVEGAIANIPILIGSIVENLQTKDSFDIPTALQKYLTLFSE